jgi:AcrR family transcriptional regulator
MASRKPSTQEIGPIGVEESLPEWKKQSVDRSLQAARNRATDRSDRFVASAVDLMGERGLDFTVQDVVDHSRMSIRTFYNFFASKDDLLVAVHETILATEVVPRLRKRCDAETDPIRRIQAYIEGMYEITSKPGPVSRALTTFRNRLAETRPEDLNRAFSPQIELVAELVRNASEAGELRTTLEPEVAAQLLHHTVLAIIHSRILSPTNVEVTPDELWLFCSSGIGADPASGPVARKHTSSRRSASRSR